jgi:hypothetical protein
VIDLSQLVMNDLFLYLGESFSYGGPQIVVNDFVKTFYPSVLKGGN